jgi:hypothetical protein
LSIDFEDCLFFDAKEEINKYIIHLHLYLTKKQIGKSNRIALNIDLPKIFYEQCPFFTIKPLISGLSL